MPNLLLALVTSVSLVGTAPAAAKQATTTAPTAGLKLPLSSWLAWLGGATPAPAGAPAAAPAAAAPTAAAVVDKVQAFYLSIKQVSARFRQSVVYSTYGGPAKTNDGNVYISKPGKMRWDYYGKKAGSAKPRPKKSFISNGASLYVVEYDNKQIFKKSLEKDLMPVAVSFLYGKGDLKTDFTSELDTSSKYGPKGALVLKLTPKKPSAQYKNLYLVVDRKDFHVTQSIIVDSSNNINSFEFFSPDFERAVADSWYEFSEKHPSVKNFRIVDVDADDKAQTSPSDVAQPASGVRPAKDSRTIPGPAPIKPETK